MAEFEALKRDCYYKALLENGVTGLYEEYMELVRYVDKDKEKEVMMSMKKIIENSPRLQELMEILGFESHA